MDLVEVAMHHAAGLAYGQNSACDGKVNYRNEVPAVRAAGRMTVKLGKQLEAYPCVWCSGWHIGRTMTTEERQLFSFVVSEKFALCPAGLLAEDCHVGVCGVNDMGTGCNLVLPDK